MRLEIGDLVRYTTRGLSYNVGIVVSLSIWAGTRRYVDVLWTGKNEVFREKEESLEIIK
jgi:hypothetical protein